jgi:hypothetical protein
VRLTSRLGAFVFFIAGGRGSEGWVGFSSFYHLGHEVGVWLCEQMDGGQEAKGQVSHGRRRDGDEKGCDGGAKLKLGLV